MYNVFIRFRVKINCIFDLYQVVFYYMFMRIVTAKYPPFLFPEFKCYEKNISVFSEKQNPLTGNVITQCLTKSIVPPSLSFILDTPFYKQRFF